MLQTFLPITFLYLLMHYIFLYQVTTDLCIENLRNIEI